MEAWHIWMTAGILLIMAEGFSKSLLLAILGLGALAASFSALLGGSHAAQVLTFSLSSIVALLVIRPLVLRALGSMDRDRARNLDMIGRYARVLKDVGPPGGAGEVRVGSEIWPADSLDETTLPAGARVKVVGVEGKRLKVIPLKVVSQ